LLRGYSDFLDVSLLYDDEAENGLPYRFQSIGLSKDIERVMRVETLTGNKVSNSVAR